MRNIKKFFDMIGEIFAEQKQPVDCGGKFRLYRSEINLLELIGSCPDANVSELSARSAVTKSAVTQISVKLCEKGLIETYKSPHNKKEKYFRLTPAGLEAKAQYEEMNKQAAAKMRSYLCALSIEEKRRSWILSARQRNICRRTVLPVRMRTIRKRRALRRMKRSFKDAGTEKYFFFR